jgi:hypothetical protein
MNLGQLTGLFAASGCIRAYAKPLAANDNSKNQVYFGPGFQALNLFPNAGIEPSTGSKSPIFKAKLRFAWLLESGAIAEAPNAQLILYPQYPEVRFSGFLLGSYGAPSALMASRDPGRILFLGVTRRGQVLGYVCSALSEVGLEFSAKPSHVSAGVFSEVRLPDAATASDAKSQLLAELRRINRLGWITSKQLDSSGSTKPCNAPQCGGFTLEAELRIAKNSTAEPDFLGWEVKQHSVGNFARVEAGVITLMTPEPNGGFYRSNGVEAFVRKFGYPDRRDVADRWNFGGVHRVGLRHPLTNLTMRVSGFDSAKGRITDPRGDISLISDAGEVAASWGFTGLLEHWSRKHAKAVYVPSQCRKEPVRQYHYGDMVRLAEGTDSLRLLKALIAGAVYYDPGIKLENASSANPTSKRRSQFRVASRDITALYEAVELVVL